MAAPKGAAAIDIFLRIKPSKQAPNYTIEEGDRKSTQDATMSIQERKARLASLHSFGPFGRLNRVKVFVGASYKLQRRSPLTLQAHC